MVENKTINSAHAAIKLKEWLSRKEASQYLESIGCPVSPRTLEKLAANDNAGRGPPFTKFRWKTVRYRRTDLDTWAMREATRIN